MKNKETPEEKALECCNYIDDALNGNGIAKNEGNAELSTWGRVSVVLTERAKHLERIAALEAENERLRTALEKITKTGGRYTPLAETMVSVARKALAGEQ
jgi:hypothetical protein